MVLRQLQGRDGKSTDAGRKQAKYLAVQFQQCAPKECKTNLYSVALRWLCKPKDLPHRLESRACQKTLGAMTDEIPKLPKLLEPAYAKSCERLCKHFHEAFRQVWVERMWQGCV